MPPGILSTYYAHTPNPQGRWHLLQEHLQGTATLARERAAKFGAGELGFRAGLLHDLGKYQAAFQAYLQACALNDGPPALHGPPHAPVGAYFARQDWQGLAFPVWGHHAGLPSRSTLKRRLADPALAALAPDISTAAEREGAGVSRAPVTLPSFLRTALDVDVFLRMLFSTLVDADRLDTERHGSMEQFAQRGTGPPLPVLQHRLSAYMDRLNRAAPPTPLNRLRTTIYERCRMAAQSDPGVYRLTAPTGGGKTLSGLAFAIDHALIHHRDRVVVAIPYTSIIEQTADVYRAALGEDAVLEHHSAVTDPDGDQAMTPRAVRRRLATENWDAPIIVTTTVQLFESLFSNRPGACRKLHNVARSVLILDEVQALPPSLLGPILSMLRTLVNDYGVTLVLSTATQPAFEGESAYLSGLSGVRDVLPDAGSVFRQLRRVNYEVREASTSWADLADELHGLPAVLVIVNTRLDARALLAALDDPEAFHLSTLLCPAHRRAVLAAVTERLKAGRPCRLVATQVVEAGVDLDFPVVFRAVGPLDRIVQAAGRCNREGRQDRGRVVIFNPEGGHSPRGPYQTATAHAGHLLQVGVNLHDPDTFRAYFQRVFADVETDARHIQQARGELDFPTVADRFRLIDAPTTSCVVPYRPDGALVDSLLRRLEAEGPSRDLLRQLAPYEVSLYATDLQAALDRGLATPIDDGLYVWHGVYDDQVGIRDVLRDPADLIL
jgi:CRISPR-associated endonuclease/helicase Cas3